jgi:Low molecular weight phosphotyrosine protein phosphatase
MTPVFHSNRRLTDVPSQKQIITGDFARGQPGLVIAIAPHPALAQGSDVNNSTIVFVCLHGSVKSQVAAAHFNKVARERGLPYTAISRGIQIDNSVPAGIRDGLSRDGLAPADEVPHQLTTAEASRATRVVAFDAVPDEKRERPT